MSTQPKITQTADTTAPVDSSTPAEKALWLVESRLDQDLSLDSIARIVGISSFHLTRAFGLWTGVSLMRYARVRPLSAAARRLAQGAPDILAVALEAGYSSHEAFTRAFREQFGLTPEAMRAGSYLNKLTLMEPLAMKSQAKLNLKSPRYEDGKPLVLIGTSERYSEEISAGIPAQWLRFGPRISEIKGQAVGVSAQVTYGVCYDGDDTGQISYLSGVEVATIAPLPEGMSRLSIAARRYAVFTHSEHIASIRQTWNAIFNQWLPASGYSLADGPQFERYDSRFDPMTGYGGFEIWIPIQP